MVKKIFLRMGIDALALFLILCGIDIILKNDIAVVTNLLIAVGVACFRNMLTLKKYYQFKLQEDELEMKNLDNEKKS